MFPKNRILFICDNCGKAADDRVSHFKRKKRHFCSQLCYSVFRRDKMPIEEHPRWTGGVSNTEAHRRWKKKNPERMAHLKARRYARERGAEGSHTHSQWEALKAKHSWECAHCNEQKPLTKDHIRPLSLGGSDFIANIQPLCRNCNSRKWKTFIHENPELLK